jgi:hypothetical protein
MEIAGHSALEMTMNVYAHVTLDKREPPSAGSVNCSRRARNDQTAGQRGCCLRFWVARL